MRPLLKRIISLIAWWAPVVILGALLKNVLAGRPARRPEGPLLPPPPAPEKNRRPAAPLLLAAALLSTLVLTPSSAPAAASPLADDSAREARSALSGLDALRALRSSAPPPTPNGSERSPFIWPVDGWITTLFSAEHAAVDLRVEAGQPVWAARDGVVAAAGGDPCCSLGYYVLIGHDGGWATVYGHLSEFRVQAGDEVRQGDIIGIAGSTGHSTGPHVHLEVYYQGFAVDPMDYFPTGIEIRLEPDPTETPTETVPATATPDTPTPDAPTPSPPEPSPQPTPDATETPLPPTPETQASIVSGRGASPPRPIRARSA